MTSMHMKRMFTRVGGILQNARHMSSNKQPQPLYLIDYVKYATNYQEYKYDKLHEKIIIQNKEISELNVKIDNLHDDIELLRNMLRDANTGK